MKSYFADLITVLMGSRQGEERFTAWFSAEELDYARFSRAKIRQAGTTHQQYLSIDWINGNRHATSTVGLSRDLSLDKERLYQTIKKLRHQISLSSEDPYLMFNDDTSSSTSISESKLYPKEDVVEQVLRKASGLDLVGYYYGGPVFKGFASSTGQMRWFEKSSFVLDTSIYHSGDKAIKQSYADERFDEQVFEQKIAEAALGLKLFDGESKTISKGEYRVYFAPAAVYELLGMLNWGGFSRKALQIKDSPLLPLSTQEKRFSPKFSLWEDMQTSVGPNFQSQGYLKPKILPIIEQGLLKNTLISPKTAKEYKLDHNGADEGEMMSAMSMAPGDLLNKDILSSLGDGLYINNLWYLNFSDRQKGCLTGMTRFFCYVVKDGKPVAPFSVMRFDDSLYRIFGDNLVSIGAERSLIIDSTTYDERSTACAYLPGIIAEKVRFTL